MFTPAERLLMRATLLDYVHAARQQAGLRPIPVEVRRAATAISPAVDDAAILDMLENLAHALQGGTSLSGPPTCTKKQGEGVSALYAMAS